MSDLAILLLGMLVSGLCATFVAVSFLEMRRLGLGAQARQDAASAD